MKSYNNWLSEEMINQIEYGCVMLYADIPFWETKHLKMILPEDINEAEGGLEHNPHISLMYGLKLNEVKPQEVKKVMEQFFPLKVSVKNVGVFENPTFDVVMYEITKKKELTIWRDQLLKFPNYQEFPDYKPHMTIAYVKKGTGRKYIREFEEGFKIIFNKAVYSYTQNEKDNIIVKLDAVS